MWFACDTLCADQSLSLPKTWDTSERGAVQWSAPNQIKMIPVRLNPNDPTDDRIFYLYYFVVASNNKTSIRKTVLFCAGGPGEPVDASTANMTFTYFLSKLGYDVVYFHLRGSGFSQIPPSNEYDRFLKTSYAAKDMDEIRKDLLGKKGAWDAVVGWSYGTILAQQYASEYSQYLKRLVLIGPISRHDFVFDAFYRDVIGIHRHSLERIYQRKEFDDLNRETKNRIIEEVFGKTNEKGIFQKTEDAFGTIQFVIDNYCNLEQELENRNLKYSRKFFQELRAIRMFGWFPSDNVTTNQLEIGSAISDEILGKRPKSEQNCRGGASSDVEISPDSRRVFYVMGAYDGIDPRFLREWLSDYKRDIGNALTESGGTAHIADRVNKTIQKVGIFDDLSIKAWDPSNYTHSVPTLILKGQADPVSAAEQAEYIFSKGLTGPRILVEFPGIGHNFSLPKMLTKIQGPTRSKNIQNDIAQKFLSGTIRFDAVNIPPGQVREISGIVTGSDLNEGLKINLTPSVAALSKGLESRGFGILEEEEIEGADKSRNNVVALIENTTDADVDAGKIPWEISNGYFTGTVSLDIPKIPAKQIRAARGTITNGRQNQERTPQFIPPKLEEGITFVCTAPGNLVKKPKEESFGEQLVASSSYNLLFQNTNKTKSVFGRQQYWTVRNAFSGESVNVKVPPVSLGPGAFDWVPVVLNDVKMDPEAEMRLVVPNELSPLLNVDCILSPQKDNTDIYIVIHNNNSTDVTVDDPVVREWTIKTACFDATLEVGPLKIQPSETVSVRASLNGVRWKKRLDLIKPPNLEPELELLGFNILGPDKVSILLRNNGRSEITTTPRSWRYVDPSKPTPCKEGPDKAETGDSRECLIYSFLVMDPENFSNANDNKILSILQSLFARYNSQESLPVRIEFCEEGTCEIGRQ
jgi:pimeloyl-ACP methyl ester carboxylesterase